jgi:hypothetical protein
VLDLIAQLDHVHSAPPRFPSREAPSLRPSNLVLLESPTAPDRSTASLHFDPRRESNAPPSRPLPMVSAIALLPLPDQSRQCV